MADDVIAFGTGDLFVIPKGTNPTPQKIGEVQEASVEFSSDEKELFGAKKFSLARVEGHTTISGKAKSAYINGALLGSIFAGSTTTTGQKYTVVDEAHAVAASVDVTSKTTFLEDRGVTNAGVRMTCVASAPQVGEYAVAAGTYTFNAAETGTVKISYEASLSTGRTVKLTNQLVGTVTDYVLQLNNVEPDGSKVGLKLYSVTIPKLAFAFKNDDFTMPDFDFKAGADANGDVFEWYLP